jgi:ribosomal protein S18 acetylase RimI-like enzyme
MRSGMALGLVDPVDPVELEASYRSSVASLDAGRRVIVVAESEGAVVGMGHLVPSEARNATHRAEVQRVAVAAGARGSGVGRELMAAVEEEARARGLTLLWLTTHSGADAARFYEAIGYTRLGVMPDYSRRPDGTLWPGAFYYRRL